MKMWCIAFVSCAALFPGVASAQSASEILVRNGKWSLDAGRDSCDLFAQFGEGDAEVIAKFTRFAPVEGFNLALLGKRMASSAARGEAKIDFGLGGAPIEASSMNGSLGKWKASFFSGLRLDGGQGILPGQPDTPITPQQEAVVTGMTVAIKGKPAFRLDFGSLAKPFALLRGCATELVSRWGYDYQVEARLLRHATPVGSPGAWVTQDDYPLDALRAGYSGFVQVRLDVDASGAIAGCHVLDRTDQEVFAITVCRAIQKRARILPALDAGGKPVKSYMMLKWRFQTG